MDFHMVSNSDKSTEYFPQNKPYSFSVYLKKLFQFKEDCPASILYKSIAGRSRPVSYPL